MIKQIKNMNFSLHRLESSMDRCSYIKVLSFKENIHNEDNNQLEILSNMYFVILQSLLRMTSLYCIPTYINAIKSLNSLFFDTSKLRKKIFEGNIKTGINLRCVGVFMHACRNGGELRVDWSRELQRNDSIINNSRIPTYKIKILLLFSIVATVFKNTKLVQLD